MVSTYSLLFLYLVKTPNYSIAAIGKEFVTNHQILIFLKFFILTNTLTIIKMS